MLVHNDPFLAEFDRLAQQVFGAAGEGVGMPMDIVRRGDGLVIRVDVPGVPAGSIALDLDDHVLTISAERHTEYGEDTTVLAQERFDGTMTRRLRVPDWVDVEGVTADHTDGVLTVALPIAEKARPRRISVTASSGTEALTA